MKDYDQAIEKFQIAKLNDPLNSPYYFLRIADAYLEKKNYRLALYNYKQALPFMPDDKILLFMIQKIQNDSIK